MAYRYDNKTGELTINGWERGIGDSPYTGPTRLNSVNISNYPASIGVGYPVTNNTISGGTLGVPIADATSFGAGAATAYYILDATGQVFKSTTPGGTFAFLSTSNSTTGSSSLDGLAYWKNYLFKFRNDKIDYLAGGAGTWQTGWKTIAGATKHYAYVATDDVLYFTNGTKIGSIIEVAGQTFDPTNGATYVFNDTALQLPTYESAQSISEAGINLLVGGAFNVIYPWNRTSTDFSYPIFFGDNFIKNIVQVNNNAYVFTGNNNGRGRIYITNGSQADLFLKIPDTVIFNQGGYIDPYYEWGDAIYHRNNLIFGFFVAQNNGSGLINSGEVWAVDLDTKALRSITSLGGATLTFNPKVLIPIIGAASPGFGYITGVDDHGSQPFIANTATAAGIGSANIFTEYIPVGSFSTKKTFSKLEYRLSAPLQTGESIIFLVTTDNDSQTIGTATPTSPSGSASGGFFPMTVQGSQWLQIQILITGISTQGVRLKDVILHQ